jgi:hypothetical protein
MDPSARFPPGDTVDVRPRHEYRVGHFASSVCCPLDELHDHLHRLPDHGEKFRVFGEEDEVARAIEYLEGRGYERVSTHGDRLLALGGGRRARSPVESESVSR